MCEWYLQNLAQLVSLQHLDSVTTYSTLNPQAHVFQKRASRLGHIRILLRTCVGRVHNRIKQHSWTYLPKTYMRTQVRGGQVL